MAAIDRKRKTDYISAIWLRRILPASFAAAVLGLAVGGWMGMSILNKDEVDKTQRSITATLDIFTPAPKGTVAEGYFAMVYNPESR